MLQKEGVLSNLSQSDQVIPYDYLYLSKMDPFDLLYYIKESFLNEIPEQVDSIEDMVTVQSLFPKITNAYSYVNAALAHVKLLTRQLKAEKDRDKSDESKAAYEEMVSRRDVLETASEVLKQQYSALSRAITVRQEINREINMGEKILSFSGAGDQGKMNII